MAGTVILATMAPSQQRKSSLPAHLWRPKAVQRGQYVPHWVGVAADAGRQLAVAPGACAEACARCSRDGMSKGPGIDLLNDRAIKQAKQLPVIRSP